MELISISILINYFIHNLNNIYYNNIMYEVFRERHGYLSSSLVFESMFTSLVKLGQSSLPFYCSSLSPNNADLRSFSTASLVSFGSSRLQSTSITRFNRSIRSAHPLNNFDTLNQWFIESIFLLSFSMICKFIGLKISLCIYTLPYFNQNC
jgi:hypothetical protein